MLRWRSLRELRGQHIKRTISLTAVTHSNGRLTPRPPLRKGAGEPRHKKPKESSLKHSLLFNSQLSIFN